MKQISGRSAIRSAGALLCAAAVISPASAWACAACYGQDSGPLASGMNWGIASLLGMIVPVLVGVAGFFVYLARRAAAIAAAKDPGLQPAYPFSAARADATVARSPSPPLEERVGERRPPGSDAVDALNTYQPAPSAAPSGPQWSSAFRASQSPGAEAH